MELNQRYMLKSLFILISVSVFFIGCGPSYKSVVIKEYMEPAYKPNFDFKLKPAQKSEVAYVIGIIETDFIEKNTSRNKWTFSTAQEKQALNDMKREIANGFEKILLSRGLKVSGPYANFEEMTYPQRERCTFLIKPTILIDVGANTTSRETVEDKETEKRFVISKGIVNGSVEMEYLILDPLTKEKMERHKLKTKTISINYTDVTGGYVVVNRQIVHRNRATNSDNVSAKILEDIFQEFISKANDLISVDEFKHLMKYKDQIREKKVY